MTGTATATTTRSTSLAGAAFVAAAVLTVLATSAAEVAVLHDLVVPLHGVVVGLLGAVLQLVGALVLALGAAGALGRRGPGRDGLVAFGAAPLAGLLLGAVEDALLPPALWQGFLSLVVRLVGVVGALVAAAAMRRAGVLHAAVRRLLAALAAADALFIVLQLVPAGEVQLVLASLPLFLLPPLLLAALGVALLLHGRSAMLRRRARALREQW